MSQVSRRALRTMGIARWLLLAAVAGAAVWSWWTFAPSSDGAPTGPDRFYCSMHPNIRSPDPGICPICSMTLEPIPEGGKAAVTSAEPEPEPRAPVMLSFERRALVGIALARAVEEVVAEEAVWPARLEVPEAAWAEVRSRTDGYVERVAPLESGSPVAAGETLAWLDAPEVAKARAELAAVRQFDPPDASAVKAAQARLKRLGDRGASGWLEVKAPIAGVVFERMVAVGGFASPEMVLFKLADVRTLRVVASAPADDAQALAALLGDPACAAAPDAPTCAARAFWRSPDGTLTPLAFDRIEPSFAPATRTAGLRFTLANAAGAYHQGTLGAVVVRRAGQKRILVPRDAVIPVAQGAIVVVETEPGVLTPTRVDAGPLFGERRAIRSGLAVGARVVTRGAFLVDAESRLEAAIAPAAAAPAAGAPP